MTTLQKIMKLGCADSTTLRIDLRKKPAANVKRNLTDFARRRAAAILANLKAYEQNPTDETEASLIRECDLSACEHCGLTDCDCEYVEDPVFGPFGEPIKVTPEHRAYLRGADVGEQ